jgi:Cu2+-exporting ATPase
MAVEAPAEVLVLPGLDHEPRRLRYRIVHSLPGRVRMRLLPGSSLGGEELASRLRRHHGVTGTRWTPAAASLTVSFDPSVPFRQVIDLALSSAAPLSELEQPRDPLWRQFLVPAVSLAAAFTGAGLATRAAIAVCASPIGGRAVRSLLRRRINVDLLDSAAVVLLLATGDTLSAGLSVALIEAGERIRQRASGRARRVLRGWMGADSHGVRVLRPGGEPRIPMQEVKPAEQVVVYAGETIPVDGEVMTGSGLVDNRTWTGEPIPRSIAIGERVLAGASLADGRIVITVAAVGDETRAGRLAVALEDAIAANTHVYDRARRVADAFVVPMLLLSGGTYTLTRDLARTVSILIIDFGTGIRISIPTTILATMIGGARRGILFKNGQSVDDLARVDTIVFDKTGTLTTGRPVLLGVEPENGFDRREVLRLAAGAEGHLPHPLARAIRRAARRAGLRLTAPESVRYLPGGVDAKLDGHRVLVGDSRFLERMGVRRPPEETAESSIAVVVVDGRIAARIRFRDSVKESARSAVQGLRRLEISSLVLATGDHRPAARAVARMLDLDRCQAGLMPEEKVRLVEDLRAAGRFVAVVGDGINDAAAMAAADVGIAVPQGADLARETADVVLLDDDLQGLVEAVRLARVANSIVRQNVGLVGAPNAVGLLLAMLGRLHPLAATMVNNGSTTLAAFNALRPVR